jgi:hypothetical protein
MVPSSGMVIAVIPKNIEAGPNPKALRQVVRLEKTLDVLY